MQSIYVLVTYRTWDQYYAHFEGYCIGTDLRWWQGLDYENDAEAAIKALGHGETAYLRLRKQLPSSGCDELVVFRYDIPTSPNKTQLHVQYTRWKYGVPDPETSFRSETSPGLVILADQHTPPPYPHGVTLHDCVYDVILTVPGQPLVPK
jgi:hypothetical protein